MSNDNKELKNNAPCEEKQEARELTEEELAQVSGGNSLNRPATPPSPVAESVNAALQTW